GAQGTRSPRVRAACRAGSRRAVGARRRAGSLIPQPGGVPWPTRPSGRRPRGHSLISMHWFDEGAARRGAQAGALTRVAAADLGQAEAVGATRSRLTQTRRHDLAPRLSKAVRPAARVVSARPPADPSGRTLHDHL